MKVAEQSSVFDMGDSGDRLSLSLLVSQAGIALEHLAFGPGWGFGPGCAWTWVGTVCSSSL